MNNKHDNKSSMSFSTRLICLILATLMVLSAVTLLLTFIFGNLL